jgi:molybdopterin converting factor small subunit
MRVKLRLFATYRQFLPKETDGNTIDVEVHVGTRVGDLMSLYGIPIGADSVILVNGITARLNDHLEEEDVVSAFPAMVGG